MSQQKAAGRRIYEHPPVHEVVLDLQFEGEASPALLKDLPQLLSSEFGKAKPIARVTAHTLVGSRGFMMRPPENVFWGWELIHEDGPKQISTISGNQLTHQFLRSDSSWPQGPYVGWEQNAARFLKLIKHTADVFEGLAIRRAGLRYVNRIAIPKRSRLSEWFTVVPPPIVGFEDLFEFSLARSWRRAPGFPGLSGSLTISMAEQQPPSAESDEKELGVILDIDIFNFWVKDAPDLSEVPQWIENAHSLENRIFRGCITPALEERFGILEDR